MARRRGGQPHTSGYFRSGGDFQRLGGEGGVRIPGGGDAGMGSPPVFGLTDAAHRVGGRRHRHGAGSFGGFGMAHRGRRGRRR